jgi:hypothetical protein
MDTPPAAMQDIEGPAGTHATRGCRRQTATAKAVRLTDVRQPVRLPACTPDGSELQIEIAPPALDEPPSRSDFAAWTFLPVIVTAATPSNSSHSFLAFGGKPGQTSHLAGLQVPVSPLLNGNRSAQSCQTKCPPDRRGPAVALNRFQLTIFASLTIL